MNNPVYSIRSELETIKHRVQDVLSCVDHKTQGLRKEMTEKTDETQVSLQAVQTSLYTRTKSLQETLADMKNDFREEARTMKVEIEINQERMERRNHLSSTGLHHGPCSGSSWRSWQSTTLGRPRRNPHI
jgi:hypothetical protein